MKPPSPLLELSFSPGDKQEQAKVLVGSVHCQKVKGGANSLWSILRWTEAIPLIIRILACTKQKIVRKCWSSPQPGFLRVSIGERK